MDTTFQGISELMTDPKNKFTDETFVVGVAHELKNPLSAIFGYADILLDTAMGDGLNPKQKEILGKIRTTALRSIEMIRNFQFLATDSFPKDSRTDLTALIGSVYESSFRDSNHLIPIKFDLIAKPLWIKGAPSQIERIVSNLLSNALKFATKDGTVTIRTIELEKHVLLEVSNTGSFIDQETKQNIFKLYGRGKNVTHLPGAGIGLYIVKLICDSLGAQLEVTSTVDRGTVFFVKFAPPL